MYKKDRKIKTRETGRQSRIKERISQKGQCDAKIGAVPTDVRKKEREMESKIKETRLAER